MDDEMDTKGGGAAITKKGRRSDKLATVKGKHPQKGKSSRSKKQRGQKASAVLGQPTELLRRQMKMDRRVEHANNTLRETRKIEIKLEKLYSDDSDDSTIRNQIVKLEGRLERCRKHLHILREKGALGEPSRLGSQIGPLEVDEMDKDQEQDHELTDDDDVQNPRKRRSSDSNSKHYRSLDGAVPEIVVIDDTPKKIKKEKKEKKEKHRHKKRKTEAASLDSIQPVEDIPAFEGQEPIDATTAPDDVSVISKSNRTEAKHAMQNEADAPPPTPEQLKQSALIDTITRNRSHSDSNSGDKIYQALLASIGAGPSPISSTSPVTSLDNAQQSLIEIGRAALTAPIQPSKQKPIRDRAFVAQAPVSTTLVQISHRESPILPPRRNFSLPTKAGPLVAKKPPIEKENHKKNDPECKKARKEERQAKKAAAKSQESQTQHQTIEVNEHAASSQDKLSNAPILPPPKLSATKILSFPNDIATSTPVTKSTKPQKSTRIDPILREFDEWEIEPGRVRSRILKENGSDDAEAEENIAFSSTYLSARPLGISISGTKFKVLHLASGTDQELPISTSTSNDGKEGMRICAVARGRVKVTLGGKKFAIGENGVWRVRGGERCTIANQLSGGARVHVFGGEG